VGQARHGPVVAEVPELVQLAEGLRGEPAAQFQEELWGMNRMKPISFMPPTIAEMAMVAPMKSSRVSPGNILAGYRLKR